MNSLVKAGEGTPKSEKKVRKILPKRIEKCQNNDDVDVATPPSSTNTEMQIAITPPATVKNASNGQYMIPVTLMTPCKKCKKNDFGFKCTGSPTSCVSSQVQKCGMYCEKLRQEILHSIDIEVSFEALPSHWREGSGQKI